MAFENTSERFLKRFLLGEEKEENILLFFSA